MFTKLLEAVFGIRDGVSWIDLDDRMRGQLRFWGVISVFVLILLVVSSLYFYVQWPPVRTVVDSVWKDVQKSVAEKGEIPKWVITVGSLWFTTTLVLSLIFFYFLVDFSKVHYKIDAATLRIIPKVNRDIRFAILAGLSCPRTSECALHQLMQTRAGVRQFMNTLFYHFANQDTIGSHNQKDKRRQVFAFWTKYYVFNYVMVISFLVWLWVCFVTLMKAPTWVACALAVATGPFVAFWWWRGRRYKQSATDFAIDQVNAFFTHAKDQVVAQAASLISHCDCPECQVKRSPLIA